MDSLLPQITELIAQNSLWAGLVLFALTLLEALLLVGLLIPIVGVMLMAGALVAQGALHPAEAILWCSAGAIVGDGLSFLLGRGLGAKRLAQGVLSGHRRMMARAKLLSRRHGVIAIAAARYLGPIRPFIPIVAGMSRSRPWAFQAASAITAPIWVISMLAPGYLAARNLHLLTTDPATGAAVALGAAILAIAAYAGWKRFGPVSTQPARLAA